MPNPNTELLFDPQYWQDRADELRAQAEALSGQPKFYAVLISQAEQFEKLVKTAEENKKTRTRILRSGFDKYSFRQTDVIRPSGSHSGSSVGPATIHRLRKVADGN